MAMPATRLSMTVRRWVAGWRAAAARRHAPAGDGLAPSLREAASASVDLRLGRDAARAEFEAMARHFGIDPARVPPQSVALLRDAKRVCALCQDVRRCLRWLAQGAGTDAPQLFCANAPLFDTIASGATSRRSGGAGA